MTQFKIRAGGFNEIKRKALRTSIPVLFLALLAVIFLPELLRKDQHAPRVNTFPILVPFMAALLAFGMKKGLNRQKRLFDSYTLTVEEDDLVREQSDTPVIRIPKKDITRITKGVEGNFTIKGSQAGYEIVVPAQIENHSELERILQALGPVTVLTSVPWLQKYSMLLMLAQLGLFALNFTSTNPIVVGISGVAIIGVMLWAFFVTRNNKNIDNRTARSSYWSMLVIIPILIRIIYTVF
jgi:hypothetical protein